MATQQRQHGLISDEYGFLVGSRRLEQGIESVDDKVQRIIEFLEKNAKPVRLVNSQTVAQNQVAKDVSKLVTLTEKSHKEIQKTKVANSQTLRNGGNIKNRQADENSNLSTRPTRTVNSQTGATNSSASVGSLAAELSTDQPTRTVNSQTSQQAQDRQRDANGRFAGLMLLLLGALFKSRKRNEPLSREEEKHNKKEIKLLERIARMGGGGGGLLGGLLGRGGGFLGKLFKGGGKLLKFGKGIPLVGALLTAMSFSGWSGKSTKEKGSTVGAGVGGIAGGAIGSLLGPVGTIVGASVGAWVGDKLGGVVAPYFKVWTDSLVKADIPAMLSKAWDGFISLIKKAFEATPFGAAQKGGSKLLEWGRGAYNTVKGTMSEAYRDTVGDSGQSAGGGANTNKPNNGGLQGTSVGEKTMALIRKHEGFSKKAYWDVNAYRTGYGSDTITDKNGDIRKVTKSSTVTKDDAERDLVRRSQIFANEARKQVGAEHWDKLPPDAQAALTSVAYNYGSLPKKVAKSVKTGNLNQISESVRELQVHNNGINKGRRNNEADIIKSATFAKTEPPAKQPVTQSSAQPTITPKATALPPTISKPPVVPSLSMKPTINMKAQPIQFRSAAKVEAIPKIESVPEMHTSPKPMLVQSVNSGDNIGQNLSDRGLAHLVTGGLGENRYGA